MISVCLFFLNCSNVWNGKMIGKSCEPWYIYAKSSEDVFATHSRLIKLRLTSGKPVYDNSMAVREITCIANLQ